MLTITKYRLNFNSVHLIALDAQNRQNRGTSMSKLDCLVSSTSVKSRCHLPAIAKHNANVQARGKMPRPRKVDSGERSTMHSADMSLTGRRQETDAVCTSPP